MARWTRSLRTRGLDEFDAIARLFRPLTGGAPEAAGLLDDAAFLPARPGTEAVVTADAVVEGVHFLPGTAPELVARKLLRVNLSDLAAKAAEPFGYWLTVAWPAAWDEAARASFARGLALDQAEFGVVLLGGDTVSTPGPLTATITALGYAPAGRAVRRSGAQAGDLLFVSGTIGDGWLGLRASRGELSLAGAETEHLASRYELPQPRLGLRSLLLEHATGCLDVSDGLIADLNHLAAASGAGMNLDLERLPISAGAEAWLNGERDRTAGLAALASGGDDYELAFTAPEHSADAVRKAAARAGVRVTAIGAVRGDAGVTVLHDGAEVPVERTGWRHG